MPDDGGHISEIANEAFSNEITLDMSRFHEDRFTEMSRNELVNVFIAEENGRVVGFLVLHEGNLEIPPQIHLVAMHRDSRGKGIGKSLVIEAVSYIKSIGGEKLKLYTRPWNRAMRKICIDKGFIPEA